jgi:hypothetical protein
VQNTFKVLPTDERFKALTDEQVGLMYESFLLDHPEAAKAAEVFRDPGYEDSEKELLVDTRAVEAREEPKLQAVEVDVAQI